MKAIIKKTSDKELKEFAEKLAGPVSGWITKDERNAYIKGVIDGIKKYKELALK